MPGTTYWWKIQEVNGTTVWTSSVWSFTHASYVNIDDFEDYNTSAEMNANWQTGYEIAACGIGVTGQAGLKLVRDAEGRHMQYTYSNYSGLMYFSETKRGFNPLQPSRQWCAPAASKYIKHRLPRIYD